MTTYTFTSLYTTILHIYLTPILKTYYTKYIVFTCYITQPALSLYHLMKILQLKREVVGDWRK
jgi:hypothetical protein